MRSRPQSDVRRPVRSPIRSPVCSHFSGAVQGRANGFTLIEMMIALAVGLTVVLAASALLHQARAIYLDLDDRARVQETGRLTLAHMSAMLAQANHIPWESALQLKGELVGNDGLRGLDDRRGTKSLTPRNRSFNAGTAHGVNGSDILMIGFFGAPVNVGEKGATVGNISGCPNVRLPSHSQDGAAGTATDRFWVIYFVDPAGLDGEPTLRCRFQNAAGAWNNQEFASGIESLQLLYGVDSDAIPGADSWYRADQMNETLWPSVRLVRIALLVRGRHPYPRGASADSFDLLGPGPNTVSINVEQQPPRLRAVFETTVMLRNAGLPASSHAAAH